MAPGDEIRQLICDHYIEPAFLLENNQKLFGLQKLLYFPDFAAQLFDYFFSFCGVNLQGEQFSWCSKFQFNHSFKPLNVAVFCPLRNLYELVNVKDFYRHLLRPRRFVQSWVVYFIFCGSSQITVAQFVCRLCKPKSGCYVDFKPTLMYNLNY